MKSSLNDGGLVFAWDDRRQQSATIVGFIFASLILHALCFYLFQVIYPPTVALLPPPGRVTLISPNTAEGRVLLRWLEAEDPALASNTQPSEREVLSLPTVQHAPSYLLHRPVLKEMPFVNADVGVPSAHPPGAVENPRGPLQSATQLFSTAVHFSAELETADLPQAPVIRFTASGQEPPRAAEFRIGVSDKGDVRYCFLETSSGDTGLDEQARSYLMLFRLPHLTARLESDSLIWGTARIDWGNDIVLPPPTTGNAVP